MSLKILYNTPIGFRELHRLNATINNKPYSHSITRLRIKSNNIRSIFMLHALYHKEVRLINLTIKSKNYILHGFSSMDGDSFI